ncbi:hypothetical protein GCM10010193_11470 [Kitasatospora atroaurantiaca]
MVNEWLDSQFIAIEDRSAARPLGARAGLDVIVIKPGDLISRHLMPGLGAFSESGRELQPWDLSKVANPRSVEPKGKDPEVRFRLLIGDAKNGLVDVYLNGYT